LNLINIVRIKTKERDVTMINIAICDDEQVILDRIKKLDHRFFCCHRSYLINMQYLISYKDGFAYMVENHEIPVSRLRKKEFSNVILQYMKEWRF